MVLVTIEIREGPLTRRVAITAHSIERALQIAGEGKSGRRVRPLSPIDHKAFTVVEDPDFKEVA